MFGNQIIISAVFSISSAEKGVCDQNVQYVIRLEDGTLLFQSYRQAPEDETEEEWQLLESYLLAFFLFLCPWTDLASLCCNVFPYETVRLDWIV